MSRTYHHGRAWQHTNTGQARKQPHTVRAWIGDDLSQLDTLAEFDTLHTPDADDYRAMCMGFLRAEAVSK